MYELARKTVRKPLPGGPFAGLPLAKGSKACKNYFPGDDSEMMRRFKKAGLLVLG